MKHLLYLFAFSLITVILLSSPAIIHSALAQGGPGSQTIELQNPLGSTNTIEKLLENIINWLATQIGPVVATLMVIIGAMFILFAGGNEERLKTGKNIILYTAIGYGIIFIGWGIKSIIEKILQ